MTGRSEVVRLRQRLDAVFARVPAAGEDIEMQSDYAKYLCVLVSGFLENSISALLLDFAQRRSAPEIAFFVERHLDYWTNPNCDKILQLLQSFNPDWRIPATAYLVEERKATVNSLVALRHKIVHGESLGTSLAQVRQYYATAGDVVNFVADLIDPPSRLSFAVA